MFFFLISYCFLTFMCHPCMRTTLTFSAPFQFQCACCRSEHCFLWMWRSGELSAQLLRPESTSCALFSSTAGGSQTASRHHSIWLECFHQGSEVLNLPGNCWWSSYFVYKDIISESIFPFSPLISERFLIFCRQWFRRVGAPRVYSGLSRESTVLVLPR